MTQLNLFGELPVQIEPALALPPPRPAPPPDPLDEVRLWIMDGTDQVECAADLAERWPDIAKDDLLAVIADCERAIVGWGCESLSVLRAELERVHPAWRAAA
jgi:hypothetical protein